jgi:hypothetical protein
MFKRNVLFITTLIISVCVLGCGSGEGTPTPAATKAADPNLPVSTDPNVPRGEK